MLVNCLWQHSNPTHVAIATVRNASKAPGCGHIVQPFPSASNTKGKKQDQHSTEVSPEHWTETSPRKSIIGFRNCKAPLHVTTEPALSEPIRTFQMMTTRPGTSEPVTDFRTHPHVTTEPSSHEPVRNFRVVTRETSSIGPMRTFGTLTTRRRSHLPLNPSEFSGAHHQTSSTAELTEVV